MTSSTRLVWCMAFLLAAPAGLATVQAVPNLSPAPDPGTVAPVQVMNLKAAHFAQPQSIITAVWGGDAAYLFNVNDSRYPNHVWRYEPSRDNLTVLKAAMPMAHTMQVGAWNGSAILLVGGTRFPTPTGGEQSPDHFLFVPALANTAHANRTGTLAGLDWGLGILNVTRKPTSDQYLTAHEGRFLLRSDCGRPMCPMARLNMSSLAFEPLRGLWPVLDFGAYARQGNSIYQLGGHSPKMAFRVTHYRLDRDTVEQSDLNRTRNVILGGGGSNASYLFVLGGLDWVANKPLDRILVFDPVTRYTGNDTRRLPLPQADVTTVTTPTDILAIGIGENRTRIGCLLCDGHVVPKPSAPPKPTPTASPSPTGNETASPEPSATETGNATSSAPAVTSYTHGSPGLGTMPALLACAAGVAVLMALRRRVAP